MLIATEKRSGAGRRAGKLHYETPMSGIAASADPICINSKRASGRATRHARKLPQELYKSLTWDRGKEMADHMRFTVATDIKVYFCDPQSLWQRGSNENTNGLLRQYFLKGIDLSAYSQAKPNAVARRLNERPRKTLDFDTPAERFHQFVASTD